MNNFPKTMTELSTQWLTEVLGYPVTEFQADILGEGVGVIGLVTRVCLTAESGPKTIIAKFPSQVPENRGVGELYDMYGREYRFYTDIAPSIPLRTPACLHASYNPDSHDFVLLLEDLDTYRIGDQIDGCNSEETELVVKALATLHASTWQPGQLTAGFDHLVSHNSPMQRDGMIGGFQMGWPVVLDKFSDLIPESARNIGDSMPGAIPRLLEAMCQDPVCVSQGDSRLDNIFFGNNEVVIIDWQAISASAPEHDLAYFLTQSLKEEVYAAKDWVGLYHAELTRAGINYPIEQCRERYRVCALYLLCYAVVIAGTLDLTNDRGRMMAKTLLGNSLRSLDSMGAFELLAS
jgi:hypothetical protein